MMYFFFLSEHIARDRDSFDSELSEENFEFEIFSFFIHGETNAFRLFLLILLLRGNSYIQ